MLWHAHLSRFSSFSFDNTTSTVSLSLSLSLFQCFTNHTQGRSEWMRCETSQLITIAFFLPLFLTNLQIPCFFRYETLFPSFLFFVLTFYNLSIILFFPSLEIICNVCLAMDSPIFQKSNYLTVKYAFASLFSVFGFIRLRLFSCELTS